MFRPILTTPPAEAPVTLEDVKAHCVVDFSDDDQLLTGLRDAAVSHLDGFRGVLGRAIVTQTWAKAYAGWCRSFILNVPDVSAVSITYMDEDGVEQTVGAGDVSLHPNSLGTLVRLSDDFDLPTLQDDNPAPITLSFTCGFGDASDVPPDLKLAISALAASWYETRANEAGKTIPMGVAPIVAKYRWMML